jgi:hypothetical protein
MNRRRLLFLPIAAGVVLHDSARAQKRKNEPESALLVGTVFRDPGFAFGGVQVLLEPSPDGKTSSKVKVKKMKAVSDTRGEFSFRVPSAPMRYTLKFQAEGFASETKEVTVSGPERQDIYVTLRPAKGGS